MENKTTLILADDHPMFLEGLLAVLNKHHQFNVIGFAQDGESALKLIREKKPDIAILDVQMPSPDGFEIAMAVSNEQLKTRIIFLTMFKEESFVQRVFEMGVMGYILKENAVNELVQAINAVKGGDLFVSAQISSYLLGGTNKKNPANEVSLTSAEKKVLALIAEEKSSREIAEALFVSYKTIENHRGNICKKLGITGNSALLKYALKIKQANK